MALSPSPAPRARLAEQFSVDSFVADPDHLRPEVAQHPFLPSLTHLLRQDRIFNQPSQRVSQRFDIADGPDETGDSVNYRINRAGRICRDDWFARGRSLECHGTETFSVRWERQYVHQMVVGDDIFNATNGDNPGRGLYQLSGPRVNRVSLLEWSHQKENERWETRPHQQIGVDQFFDALVPDEATNKADYGSAGLNAQFLSQPFHLLKDLRTRGEIRHGHSFYVP
jgi:hypothetical protein